MNKMITLVFSLAILTGHSYSQTCADMTFLLRPLTPLEEAQLKSLPVMKMDDASRSRDLPYAVDNSTQSYMRPIFQQDGLCCGQAAGIGYNYTYEINRARNLPANVPQNQYVTHFTWNFMNGGQGWYGVSYLHSFQILKHCGNPNVPDYGGALGYGGGSRWMSGYPEYFNSMSNRINNAYQILADTPEGLLTLKNWIHNHLDGSAVGGVANYYAQYMSASQTLPAGTPEGGKYVLTYFGGSANHAMTIVGYNDSIRWDYNNDGMYTNNIDINGDGEVNMKDWEIGGLKMAQSYGGAPTWGNQGYAYMMYKTLADNLGQGGIWNHSVHILDVKSSYTPQVTAKVILKHDKRNQIKVQVGLANSPNATTPEFVMDFPIFHYQGDAMNMQGGSTEEDKTIEFGLDLSPFLTYVELGEQAKIFLQIIEKDPGGSGTGQITHFSVFDLTDGSVEITCPQSNYPLENNDTTTLSIIHTFDFDRIHILDEFLPPAPMGQPYNHQMTASGGTTPYIWEFDRRYNETTSFFTFPQIDEEQLSPSNNSSGIVTKALEFDFPYFDSVYSSVTLHVDGYLMFDEQLYPYPYYWGEEEVLFSITRNIAPFMNHKQTIYTSGGDGLWYEGDENHATFRWKTSLDGNSAGTDFNYVVTLYPDGRIEYFYGTMTGCADNRWVSGISDGNDETFQYTEISNDPAVAANSKITLERYTIPEELEISEEGLITGTPQQLYNNVNIPFKVTDNNFISSFITLPLSSNGLVVIDSIRSGDDLVIEYGETALMSVTVVNLEDQPMTDAVMTISIEDEYITVTDSTENLGTLIPGIPLKKINVFSFEVDPTIPNDHLITINTYIETNDTVYENPLIHIAYAPIVTLSSVVVNDDNNRLDPGDTTDITVSFINTGGAEAYNLLSLFLALDTLTQVLQGIGTIPWLEPGQEDDLVFQVAVNENALNGQEANFRVIMNGGNNYQVIDTFALVIGFSIEDFETAAFNLVNWGFRGNRDWKIDNENRFEGNYAARSGYILDSEESSMMVDMNVIIDGEISFYKMVSCEDDTSTNNNYDYLTFLIDGVEQGRWDGITDWSQSSYPITAGFHRFEWRYHKDATISRGMDGAWVDYIHFPSITEGSPATTCNPGMFEHIMRPDEVETDTLWITNGGQGDIDYELYISNLPESHSSGRSILGSYLVCDQEYLQTAKVYTWNFVLYNSSSDNEWIENLYIEFPTGVELTQVTDFTGGSGGDLVFQGVLGNGATAHWHGEDANGWGVVHGGQTASGSVTVYIHEELFSNAVLNYEMVGDIYGNTPHNIYGEIWIENLGAEVDWLSLDNPMGTIPGNGLGQIVLSYNSTGLEDGIYTCDLIVKDNFQHQSVIPVTLTVDHSLGISNLEVPGKKTSISVVPNPFSNQARIIFLSESDQEGILLVYDGLGLLIDKITPLRLRKGYNEIKWNEANKTGLCYFVMITKQGQSVTKAIKVN